MVKIFEFLQQRDKQLHIATNIVGVMIWQFLMPLHCAIQLQLLIGIAKEGYDRAHPLIHTSDVMDIVANLLGIYIGVICILGVRLWM